MSKKRFNLFTRRKDNKEDIDTAKLHELNVNNGNRNEPNLLKCNVFVTFKRRPISGNAISFVEQMNVVGSLWFSASIHVGFPKKH